ncbi:MAG: 50S ribosomal protein L5 [Cyanobacteria bacterium SW_9_47_5]|nr:MAG: 50S ribosomal protein L5 [Cyanobacteria bacterium SW_9_47_5]
MHVVRNTRLCVYFIMCRLKTFYESEVRPTLKNELSYDTLYQVPKIEKIVINRGIGEGANNTKYVQRIHEELTQVSAQRAVITKAKKSIAAFKLRKNAPIGVCVTLRGERMFAFLDRLINLALPRIRDFQGIKNTSFDGRGNYNLGVRDQLIFPEIAYENLPQLKGMDITIVTTAKNNSEGFYLLSKLGMPFESA